MNEQVIYKAGDVTVTTSKVVIKGTSFFLRNIASVSVASKRNGSAWLLVVVGAMVMIAGLGAMSTGQVLLGAVIATCSIFVGFRSHYLQFDTASGSVNALRGKPALLRTLKDKIEQAIATPAEAIPGQNPPRIAHNS
jgi:hypothetical protein